MGGVAWRGVEDWVWGEGHGPGAGSETEGTEKEGKFAKSGSQDSRSKSSPLENGGF